MLRPSWARLAATLPPTSSAWVLRQLSPDRLTAKVERVPSVEAVRAILDEALTTAGWSFQLLPLGTRAMVCNLTADGVTRAGVYELPLGVVPGSALGSAAKLAEGALASAAAMFGLTVDGGEAWVDHDPESGEVLLDEPEASGPSTAPPGLNTEDTLEDSGERGPLPAAPPSERPEAHVVIDRLVERLKAEGLGAAAAKLVVRYGGYGRDAEESRELYGRLRALLMDKVTVPS